MERVPYLIIGNSVAAVAGVEAIRRADPDGPIAIVAREPHHTYSRPLISYLLAGKVGEQEMYYRGPDFYERHRVTARLGEEIVGLDVDRRAAVTSAGERVGFEKLLLAVGGTPILPPGLPGADAPGVFTFTTWEDARRIAAWIERHGVDRAVVVGGGLIGLKSMEALVARGLKVSLVELADSILSATFERTASELARARLEGAGVNVRCGTTVSKIEREDGRVGAVVLRTGERIPCGLVLFAIGVRPNIDPVADTPVEVDRGVLVDETMETSLPGVYAAGDVAQGRELLSGERRTIPIFPNAFWQGRAAGSNMAGGARHHRGAIAMNSVDVLGLPTISVGRTDPADATNVEILERLDEGVPQYRRIVLRNDRVIGAVFVGAVDRAGIVTGLIREQIDVAGFKDVLLTDEFGLISLPAEYRKHVVSGAGIEV